ncbi:MAG: hypothetical protein ACTHOG_08885, partial [Marmoricola sp.]
TLALAGVALWFLGIAATAIRVEQIRAELSGVASEVARHGAEHGGDVGRAQRYLHLRLRRSHLRRVLSSASIRLVDEGVAPALEVRLGAEVGFALGGHPRIRIAVVRSAPVEGSVALP